MYFIYMLNDEIRLQNHRTKSHSKSGKGHRLIVGTKLCLKTSSEIMHNINSIAISRDLIPHTHFTRYQLYFVVS